MPTGLPSFLYTIGKNLLLRSFWLFLEFSVLTAIRVRSMFPADYWHESYFLAPYSSFSCGHIHFQNQHWRDKRLPSLYPIILQFMYMAGTQGWEKNVLLLLICPNRVVTLQKPFLPPLWWLWCNMITPQVHGSRDKKLV